MSIATSKDGTQIEYDKLGKGPTVILVGGALTYRPSGLTELAKLLAQNFMVYDYDRRGRGGSEDTLPYAVEREVEDIEALIDNAGGSAYIYGHSSGAVLAMEAAIKLGGKKVKKLAMYEAPYNNDKEAQLAWKEYIKQLTKFLAANRGGDAVALFMKYVGMPTEQIEGTRHAPFWPNLEAMAPTLAYDHTAIIGEDASVPTNLAKRVLVPTIVMSGGASFPFMHETAQALSKAIPHAELRILEDQTHEVKPNILAPVLTEFFKD